MAKIVIKKKVDLGFLGEDYNESYLTFKAISIREYEEYTTKIKEMEGDEQKSAKFIIDLMKKNYVEGKFNTGEELIDVAPEDLEDFDIGTLIKCFSALTGQEPDPKK